MSARRAPRALQLLAHKALNTASWLLDLFISQSCPALRCVFARKNAARERRGIQSYSFYSFRTTHS